MDYYAHKAEVQAQIKEIYHSHNGVDGYRSMTVYLERKGYFYSPATVHKYMNTELGLHSIVRPKKPGYEQGKPHKVFENKLAIVSGDRVIMDYTKIHPFSFSGEDRVYRAGSRICQANVKDLRLGGYICYDLRFPEIFSAARDSYDAILVIANWPEERVVQWEALLRARAIENQAYVIGVNRVGMGKRERYVPSSHIYDVYGNEMAERVSDRLLVAELDPAVIAGARKTFPQGRDRKNEFYMSIL